VKEVKQLEQDGNVKINTMKDKKFEPHMMYDAKKAETHKEHLELKNKGYGHSPNKMRNAPLKAFASPMKGKLKPCQKTAAKKKFDVYPSAYANMWASNHKC